MQLRLEPLPVRTRFAFRIAHGSKQEYRNVLVRLEHEGVEGFGEHALAVLVLAASVGGDEIF